MAQKAAGGSAQKTYRHLHRDGEGAEQAEGRCPLSLDTERWAEMTAYPQPTPSLSAVAVSTVSVGRPPRTSTADTASHVSDHRHGKRGAGCWAMRAEHLLHGSRK